MTIPNNCYLELIYYKDFSVVIRTCERKKIQNADFAEAIKKGNEINMKISSQSSHAYMRDLSSPYPRISKLFSNFVFMKLKSK